MRSEFWQLSSQWNSTSCCKLGTCSSLWLACEKRNYLTENFSEKCWESKVSKLKYLITAWLHFSNPLWRKDVRQKLVFTVAVLLKGNQSFFSKQLIPTRGCGSHSWKLLKSSMCSRVQLIPNCFSNRSISYTNWTVVHVMLVIGQYAPFCARCCGALCWVNCCVFRHS